MVWASHETGLPLRPGGGREATVGKALAELTGKLTSVEVLRKLQAAGALDGPPMPGPHLRLDTSAALPDETAKAIAASLGLTAN